MVLAKKQQESGKSVAYRIAPGSEGVRRDFRITLGLREGYSAAGKIYDVEEAIRAAHRWMEARAAKGLPFVTGMFTRGEIVYGLSPESNGDAREPVAIFTGDVLPPYAGDLDDSAIEVLLNDLAAVVGQALGQEHVYIVFGDRTWMLERQGNG